MQQQSPDNNDKGELNKLRLLVNVMMMAKDLAERDRFRIWIRHFFRNLLDP